MEASKFKIGQMAQLPDYCGGIKMKCIGNDGDVVDFEEVESGRIISYAGWMDVIPAE